MEIGLAIKGMVGGFTDKQTGRSTLASGKMIRLKDMDELNIKMAPGLKGNILQTTSKLINVSTCKQRMSKH